MKSFRDIRVIPVALAAIFGLAVLKLAGLMIDGGYVFDYQPQATKPSWAQQTFNFPTGKKMQDIVDITGSVESKPKDEAIKAPADLPELPKPTASTQILEQAHPVSPSERAILERLQARRQELETRAREIDIRENLLKAAEKRIESRAEELKSTETRSGGAAEKNESEANRFKALVIMYEGMKPKDAAKVFDRLEMPVLFEIASHIAPRKMSDILGLMSAEAAEKLTVEMARSAGGGKSASSAELPKIEGKMLPRN